MLDSINIQNAPKNFFSINYVNDLLVKDVVCNNTAGDELNADGRTLGHNTDAFNINNAVGVIIQNARVWNQDDCVAVNSGQDVLFKDGLCHGGHGGSIGSVGGRSNNIVNNITFENVLFENSQQAVRIVGRLFIFQALIMRLIIVAENHCQRDRERIRHNLPQYRHRQHG